MGIHVERIRLPNLTATDVVSAAINASVTKKILDIEDPKVATTSIELVSSILPLPLEIDDDTALAVGTVSESDAPRTSSRQTGLSARAGRATGDLIHDLTSGRAATFVQKSKCVIYMLSGTKFTPRNFDVVRGASGFIREDRRGMQDLEDEMVFDSFSLGSVAEASEEKYQILETFGNDIVYFFGRRPRIWSYQGTILNGPIFRMLQPAAETEKAQHADRLGLAKNLVSLQSQALLGRGTTGSLQEIALLSETLNISDQTGQDLVTAANGIITTEDSQILRLERQRQTVGLDWKNQFQRIYEKHYRGTRCVENRSRIYISYEHTIVEGFLLNLQVSFGVPMPSVASMNFLMFITGVSHLDGPLGNERLPSILDLSRRNAERDQHALLGEQIIRGVVPGPRSAVLVEASLAGRQAEEDQARSNILNLSEALINTQRQIDSAQERITELDTLIRTTRALTEEERLELSGRREEHDRLANNRDELQNTVRVNREVLANRILATDSVALSSEHIVTPERRPVDRFIVAEEALRDAQAENEAREQERTDQVIAVERTTRRRDAGLATQAQVDAANVAGVASEAAEILSFEEVIAQYVVTEEARQQPIGSN